MSIYFSTGNKKLKPSQDINFLIFNIPAKITCPFATDHCKALCYAIKAEIAYPDVLPSRQRNLEATRRDDFVEVVTAYILKKFKSQRKAKLIVRIHESGDFYNKAYAGKWLAIARNCKEITFMAYTKSFKFFDGVKLPRNFVLRASIWDDTTEESKEIIARNKWSTYSAVDKFTSKDKFCKCRCEDCATCGKCWSKTKDIRCEIH